MTIEELKSLEALNEFALTEPEEAEALSIFDFMNMETAKLKNINTHNIDIMVHCMPMINVFREDVREQAMTRESLLEGAPEHNVDYWVVPRLVK